MATPCAGYHPAPGPDRRQRARPQVSDRLGAACLDCHAPDDPHADQFTGRRCESCHGTRTFRIPDFDHQRTDYELDGAHIGLACVECHQSEPAPGGGQMTRYRPLGTECADCHGGDV